MIEVFKTSVNDPFIAGNLIAQIQARFKDYLANFDLEDCDLILRIKSANEHVDAPAVISLLAINGFEAEVLPDELQST
jgi:hypothetical protein